MDTPNTPETPDPPDAPEKKNGRKTGSNKEFEERIEFTALLLSKGLPKCVIKRNLKDAYQISHQMAQIYLTRGRKKLLDWTNQPKEEHRVDALAFYRSLIQEPQIAVHDKLRAHENIVRLLGLEPPQEHRMTGDRNNPVVVTIQEILTAKEKTLRWRHERFGDDSSGSQAPAAIEL